MSKKNYSQESPYNGEEPGITSPSINSTARNFELPDGAISVSTNTQEAFICEAMDMCVRVIKDAQHQNPFRQILIGLSGGSTPGPVYAALHQLAAQQYEHRHDTHSRINFDKILFFLVDERYVTNTHKDSNQRLVRETLFGQVLKDDGFTPMNGVFQEKQFIYPDTSLPIDECIKNYNDVLLQHLASNGVFDLLLLGLGPDYHTASLFPPISTEVFEKANDPKNLVLYTQTDRFAVKDRISFSLYVLRSAKKKCFLLNGKEKLGTWVHMINAIPQDPHLYPALPVISSGGTYVLSYPSLDDYMQEVKISHTSDRLLNVYNQITPSFQQSEITSTSPLTIIVMGASGDLAKKKTFPAIFSLFCEGYLPQEFNIIGYARSKMTLEEFWASISPQIKALANFFTRQLAPVDRTCENLLLQFKARCSYEVGNYDNTEDLAKLNLRIRELEGVNEGRRLLYLALPPRAFASCVSAFRQTCWSSKCWNRVVVEKPFGKDSKSSQDLSTELMRSLREEEIYRIDHYLGKEMTLAIFSLRFANTALMPIFHRHNVKCVRITFKEDIGTYGRGGYFDEYGIIRDVMQNHMLQLLSLIAMEPPASTRDEDIRDEKVKVLRQIPPITLEETIIGQYVASADGKNKGYLDDPTVPKDSISPTFCTSALWINNDRWKGVPFVMKAGKALEKRGTEIRIQLQPVGNAFFEQDNVAPNELVILLQPREAVYLKLHTKKPGLTEELQQTELDLSVMDRFQVERLPDAYERLLLDVIRGDKRNFVRTDELFEAWRIFTPLLHAIEQQRIKPLEYAFGSQGPEAAYQFIQRLYAYHTENTYSWNPPQCKNA